MGQQLRVIAEKDQSTVEVAYIDTFWLVSAKILSFKYIRVRLYRHSFFYPPEHVVRL